MLMQHVRILRTVHQSKLLFILDYQPRYIRLIKDMPLELHRYNIFQLSVMCFQFKHCVQKRFFLLT